MCVALRAETRLWLLEKVMLLSKSGCSTWAPSSPDLHRFSIWCQNQMLPVLLAAGTEHLTELREEVCFHSRYSASWWKGLVVEWLAIRLQQQ